MVFKADENQKKAIGFINEHMRCLICMEPGMGKITSVLTAMYELKYDMFEKKKIVIVSSEVNVINRWMKQLSKWSHLSTLSSYRVYTTKSLQNIEEYCDIYFTSVKMLSDLVSHLGAHNTILIIDDVNSLENNTSTAFLNIKRVADNVERVIVIGDWNIRSNLGVLWNVCFLLDSGKRLGTCRETFLEKYFYRYLVKKEGHRVMVNDPKPESWKLIREMIKDICFEVSAKGKRRYKVRVINRYISLNKKEYSKYLLSEQIANIASNMLDTDEAEEYILSAAQSADGMTMKEDGTVELCHKKKLEELKRIISAMPYTKTLVVLPFLFESKYLIEYIPRICEIKNHSDFEIWLTGQGMTAFVYQDNKELLSILEEFNRGSIITFRQRSLFDFVSQQSKQQLLQCNILVGSNFGY